MTFDADAGARAARGAFFGGLLVSVSGAVMLACLSTATAQTPSRPVDGAASQARSLAATCAACHGTDGAAVSGSAMVALAGYPADALVSRMRAFRDGSRDATVMHQIARGYTDAQIASLARYFAARPAGRP